MTNLKILQMLLYNLNNLANEKKYSSSYFLLLSTISFNHSVRITLIIS